ncbi:MAG TPA: glucoamylase family protein, partial [Opitutaceae bacterium]|nr:glucoamylase family protein [Opitutaceae bacterium]
TGVRVGGCELSSIDSALLFAGAIVAREYFDDPEITELTNRLLGEVDWEWFRNGGTLVSLGWHPEPGTGFSRYRWNKYSEHLLMSFMALGVSARPVEPEYWQSWDRTPLGRYGDYVYLQEPPLFVHQFPHAFLDMRDRRDAHADYFKNSRLATLAQRQMSIDLRHEFPSWSEVLWGLTASDSATGYKAWGGPPRTQRFNALDGTVVPCAAAGSLLFAPAETLAVLHHMRSAHGDRVWKRYGFVDAFNLETGWVNKDVIGIDLGISLVQAENLRTGLIQRLFMQSAEAKLALSKAGLFSTRRDLTEAEAGQVQSLAALAWRSLDKTPSGPGLQLTAVLAALRLGLLTEAGALERAQPLLDASLSTDTEAIAQHAAGLLATRQALPALAQDTTASLEALQWSAIKPGGGKLGDAQRLAVFLQVARGAWPADEWTSLARTTEALGPVHVLTSTLPSALLPGLWLDESEILTGASAAQRGYAWLFEYSPTAPDAFTLALLLDKFPGEVVQRFGWTFDREIEGSADEQAALLIAAANLLTDGGVRAWFQQDPLVKAGRSAIPEFSEAAFGANTSVFAQRELAGRENAPAQRRVVAGRNGTAPSQHDWQTVTGLEFKDSGADVLPGDAPVMMRFAFTWDERALHFHAEVNDTPEGFNVPPQRNRMVELFIDPPMDGLAWLGPRDYQFAFIHSSHFAPDVSGSAREFFNAAESSTSIRETDHGYTVEASIPWSSIGITPRAGLEIGVSPAVVSEGTREWEASLKLNWSYYHESETQARLGVLRLE